MNLNTKTVDNVIVVDFAGKIDFQLSIDFEIELNEIIQKVPEKHFLFNLEEVEYMDSSGIRLFIATSRILEKTNRNLKLCNLNSSIKMIFRVIKLIDMFEIFESEVEALASFKK